MRWDFGEWQRNRLAGAVGFEPTLHGFGGRPNAVISDARGLILPRAPRKRKAPEVSPEGLIQATAMAHDLFRQLLLTVSTV